ncbi:hypothetical protein HYFRA_00002967 [Hymenoscyphus fraxineus]|uniref:Uncharacterized protein n=1 Tax=Hymenoscyphus fraxineus TaxID=746836 RepID=A0A9N9KNU6_9HELO|nr:hypothetical protein HYFRA_00002967 [Hymenoscyphus fraxineus]
MVSSGISSFCGRLQESDTVYHRAGVALYLAGEQDPLRGSRQSFLVVKTLRKQCKAERAKILEERRRARNKGQLEKSLLDQQTEMTKECQEEVLQATTAWENANNVLPKTRG